MQNGPGPDLGEKFEIGLRERAYVEDRLWKLWLSNEAQISPPFGQAEVPDADRQKRLRMSKVQRDQWMGRSRKCGAPPVSGRGDKSGRDGTSQKLPSCRPKGSRQGPHAQKSMVAESLKVRGVPIVTQPSLTAAQ